MNDKGEGGFTLLEVLVALVILVTGLAAFYRAFGVSQLASVASQREGRQTLAAERLLAELGRSRPLQDGTTTGEFADGQHWSLRLEPVVPAGNNSPASPVTGHLATLEVLPANGRGTPLDIRTLVLGVAP